MRAIITGAASGIGRAVAERLSQDPRFPNPRLLLVDRDQPSLEILAVQLRDKISDVDIAVADLMVPESAQTIVDHMETRFGGIDAVVSNAGGVRGGPLKDLDIHAFDHSFHLNTRPTWLLGKAAYNSLKASRGAIVATASTAGEHPTPPLGFYSASKAALIMLMRQMAVEWGDAGIRCNTVSPGPTVTGITREVYSDPVKREQRISHIPLGRLGQPEDIAEAILFLIHENSAHISGVNLTVDGGMTAGLMRGTGSGSGNLRNQ